jgi:ribosomal protein L21E
LITEYTWDDTEGLQNNIREKITVEQQRWKERYDSRYAKSVIYNVGDMVFIKKSPDVTGDSTKLQSKYQGPLVVTEVASKDVYRVAGLKAENGRRYSTTVHVSHIKGYHLPETDDEAEETQQKSRKKNDHRWKNLRERKLSQEWTMILENRDDQQGTVNHRCGMVATI